MALAAGLGWVGITVWGEKNVFEYPNRPGELFIEVTSPQSGDVIVTRLAEGDKGVRFLDFSTSPPTALPIGQRLPNNPSLANGGGATLRRRTGTLPSGGRYEVVQEGTGRMPTLNDRVKIDRIAWSDAFNGQDKDYDRRGVVVRVSDGVGWWREAMLSMREGEVRRIILPDGRSNFPYRLLRLISIEED